MSEEHTPKSVAEFVRREDPRGLITFRNFCESTERNPAFSHAYSVDIFNMSPIPVTKKEWMSELGLLPVMLHPNWCGGPVQILAGKLNAFTQALAGNDEDWVNGLAESANDSGLIVAFFYGPCGKLPRRNRLLVFNCKKYFAYWGSRGRNYVLSSPYTAAMLFTESHAKKLEQEGKW